MRVYRTSLETGNSTFKLKWKPTDLEEAYDGDCLSSEGFGGLPRYWSCLLLWLEAFRITCEYLQFGLKHESSLRPARHNITC